MSETKQGRIEWQVWHTKVVDRMRVILIRLGKEHDYDYATLRRAEVQAIRELRAEQAA